VDGIAGYFTALGLSTAAGLNAYIPLLTVGLLNRYTDLIDLPAPWDNLGDPLVLGVVGVVGVADFIGDKVPIVDHVLHLIGTVVAPVVGGVLASPPRPRSMSAPASLSRSGSPRPSRRRSAGLPRAPFRRSRPAGAPTPS
jgi:uncharacterized protein DUF4126